MSKGFIFAVIGVFAIFISVFVISQFTAFNLPGKNIANEIPKYPNSTNWSVTSSCGIPGEGICNTYATFQTSDREDKVFDYYKNELPKIGINFNKEGKFYDSTPPLDVPTGSWLAFQKGKTSYQLGSQKQLFSASVFEYRFSISNQN